MIRHNKSNNVKYRRIKTNKLFGLDRKSQFKTNNYSFFYLLMSNSAKNMWKWLKNVPKCPLFDSIWQYSTLFNFKKGIRFLFKTNRLACFDPIWVPNSETSTEYSPIIFFQLNNSPKLTILPFHLKVDLKKAMLKKIEHFFNVAFYFGALFG